MRPEEKEFVKSVGHRLTVRMAEMSIDIKTLSENTGVRPQTITNHRKGHFAMNIYTLYAYAKALHCDINYFLPNQ